MRFALVLALLRLYPLQWRAEYGDEFALLLLRRPLTGGAVLNVVANALWQHVRTGTPWRIASVPLLLWSCVCLMLSFVAPEAAAAIGNWPAAAGMALFFAIGFWTAWRSGQGGGIAAAKLQIVASAPFFIWGLVRAIWFAAAMTLRLPQPPETTRFDISSQLLIRSFPYAALFGWLGGLAARETSRIRRNRATS